ncbi:molybdenum cofactor biosynthesis protein MoaE [Acetobacter orleanensis]|uniref:Molybdopterin synthase catalytic subunit n=1 Tax=Acetobacter orleanensis TaxID=104099 RepID=A0A4Y3TFN9_9PROT|nr:molybdenum cofactor biosynthesis protein MoaE [Acetobacter orleanensis]KXV62045.1 molybdopterin synthase catalytic subunit [Acetobacter orleanensis]PCD80380.1 molybdopterin synthase catalytic subunit [Acetobacter orleanensis]GAN68508.1 molybdopterin converting factor large subunit MoeE [Acetobacter orleanensis JCM 7639]GBR26197.1 molybdopterin converting factor large subunit MoeE [Acetobacter orleanensis NRIC 0473]GEB81731.1 molybdopterin guanine dinucleotide biosynthesis protein MoaE [Acet
MLRVLVQSGPFEMGAEMDRLSAGSDRVGGISVFMGQVRGGPDGLESLTLEHYPGMTEKVLTGLAREAVRRFSLIGCTLIHRVGTLVVGAPIVFVGASSAHRAEALAATNFLIDRLKTGAPFWKCERYQDGRRVWVEAREADDKASALWG